jgi:hypothetical protein
MRYLAYCGIAICLLAVSLTGESQSASKPSIVSLMIDFNMPPSSNYDQIKASESNLIDIYNELVKRSLNGTLFLTQDVTSSDSRLFMAQLGQNNLFELAISGNHSDEHLSSLSYDEQKAILERSKMLTEACKVCGVNEIIVRGFMPQSFDQNADTYKALDEAGIEYNTGFQAGVLYAPGHENDVWPYRVENHEFYAVPVSTYVLSGEKMPLDDQYAKEKGLSSSQWYDLLVAKLNEISGKDEPLAIRLSTSTSGTGDYLDALKKFLDYAVSNDAKFVKASDLVNMSRMGSHEVPTPQSSSNTKSSECSTCNGEENLSINITGLNESESVNLVLMPKSSK